MCECDNYSIPDIISQSRLNQKLPRGTTSPRQRSHRASFHRSLCLLRVLRSTSFSNQLIRAICLLLYIFPTFSTHSTHQATTSQFVRRFTMPNRLHFRFSSQLLFYSVSLLYFFYCFDPTINLPQPSLYFHSEYICLCAIVCVIVLCSCDV
jgi:hypothetical protein